MKFVAAVLSMLAAPLTGGSGRAMLRLGGIFLGAVVLFSAGFHVVMGLEGREFTWATSVYWTLVTMTTLGFGDIVFESDIGRMYSVVVLLTGALLLLVILPFTFVQLVYLPWRAAVRAARTPRVLPEDTAGHILLTGRGPMEEALIRRATVARVPYVVIVEDIDEAATLHDRDYPVMVGDLDDPATYRAARAESAAMVLTAASDQTNTNVAFTVREVTAAGVLVATASSPDAVDVLHLAGADRVVELGDTLGRAFARRILVPTARSSAISTVADVVIAETSAAGTSTTATSATTSSASAVPTATAPRRRSPTRHCCGSGSRPTRRCWRGATTTPTALAASAHGGHARANQSAVWADSCSGGVSRIGASSAAPPSTRSEHSAATPPSASTPWPGGRRRAGVRGRRRGARGPAQHRRAGRSRSPSVRPARAESDAFPSGEFTDLLDVRTAVHDGFDRVVLETAGTERPAWSVTWTDEPRLQPADQPADVEGEAFLEISLTASDEWGEGDTYPGPDRIAVDGHVVHEVVKTSDFEGRTVWTVGLEQAAPFAVDVHEDPTRLIVDVVDQ